MFLIRQIQKSRNVYIYWIKLKINIAANKGNINYACLVIVIAFITSILFVSSNDLSFAVNENKNINTKNIQDNKKDITVTSTNKTKEILNVELKSYVRDDIENPHYPDQFYACGYPQQLITDYNSFAKVDCQ